MAIQEVNIGLAANDGTGDDPRTGISKVNANFTDTTNMAALLAQTSPTDPTAGRGLTTDSTHTTAGVLYTGGNLNPNVFGGLAASDFIGHGYAVSTTAAFFFLPISGLSKPLSSTIVGTFKVANATTTVTTGITSLDMSLSGNSSNKLAAILVTNLTGLVADQNTVLSSDSVSGKITVNF